MRPLNFQPAAPGIFALSIREWYDTTRPGDNQSSERLSLLQFSIRLGIYGDVLPIQS